MAQLQYKIVQVEKNMNEELKRFENVISRIIGQKFTNITQGQECKGFWGLASN